MSGAHCANPFLRVIAHIRVRHHTVFLTLGTYKVSSKKTPYHMVQMGNFLIQNWLDTKRGKELMKKVNFKQLLQIPSYRQWPYPVHDHPQFSGTFKWDFLLKNCSTIRHCLKVQTPPAALSQRGLLKQSASWKSRLERLAMPTITLSVGPSLQKCLETISRDLV